MCIREKESRSERDRERYREKVIVRVMEKDGERAREIWKEGEDNKDLVCMREMEREEE